MSRVYVLFHDLDLDLPRKLNECLKQKNALVGPEAPVQYIEFPDGWLIVCYDDEPSQEIKDAILAKVSETEPQLVRFFIHRTDTKGGKAKQAEFALKPKRFENCKVIYYSHEANDEIYKGLVEILTHSKLEDLLPAIEKAERETLAKRFSILKHRAAHIFLPIDIDLQGLAESNFNQEYWKEVVETYNDNKWLERLNDARQLFYCVKDNQESFVGIVDEAISKADGDHKTRLDHEWGKVKALLPEKDAPARQATASGSSGPDLSPDGFSEARLILEWLGHHDKREDVWNRCNGMSNPFHDWFVDLDTALDELRSLLLEGAERQP